MKRALRFVCCVVAFVGVGCSGGNHAGMDVNNIDAPHADSNGSDSNGNDSSSNDASVTDAGDAATDIVAVDGLDSDDVPPGDVATDTGPDTTCPTGQSFCGTVCVSTVDNPEHCGDCSTVCTGATPICNGRTCVASCTGAMTVCSGTCVNTNTDNNNCGSCGNVCPVGARCNAGTCACMAPYTNCPTSTAPVNCVDTRNDAHNCGACGRVVCHGEICVAGNHSCAPGLTACGGSPGSTCLGCTNITEDPQHCGGCGAANLCLPTQVCSAGSCGVACPVGTVNCASSCVGNVMTDVQHCGCTGGSTGGGTVCAPGTFCVAGMCVVYSPLIGCTTCPCATCSSPTPMCCAYPSSPARDVCAADCPP